MLLQGNEFAGNCDRSETDPPNDQMTKHNRIGSSKGIKQRDSKETNQKNKTSTIPSTIDDEGEHEQDVPAAIESWNRGGGGGGVGFMGLTKV
jgi:hypothetical protein